MSCAPRPRLSPGQACPWILSTSNVFTSEWLKELEVGYQMHGSFSVAGKEKFAYGKLQYFLQKLNFSPIELPSPPMELKLLEKISEILALRREARTKLTLNGDKSFPLI